jgi:hypothetical protein
MPTAADQGGGTGGGRGGGGGGAATGATGAGVGRGGGFGRRPEGFGKGGRITGGKGGNPPRGILTQAEIHAAKLARTGLRAFSTAELPNFKGNLRQFALLTRSFHADARQIGIRAGRLVRTPGFTLPTEIDKALTVQEDFFIG